LRSFRELREAAGIFPTIIHTSYLINLASEDEKILTGSLRLLKNDLEVAASGGGAGRGVPGSKGVFRELRHLSRAGRSRQRRGGTFDDPAPT